MISEKTCGKLLADSLRSVAEIAQDQDAVAMDKARFLADEARRHEKGTYYFHEVRNFLECSIIGERQAARALGVPYRTIRRIRRSEGLDFEEVTLARPLA
jgi:hypothetical protein